MSQEIVSDQRSNCERAAVLRCTCDIVGLTADDHLPTKGEPVRLQAVQEWGWCLRAVEEESGMAGGFTDPLPAPQSRSFSPSRKRGGAERTGSQRVGVLGLYVTDSSFRRKKPVEPPALEGCSWS